MAHRPLAGSFSGGADGPVIRKRAPAHIPPPRIVFPGPLTGEVARWLSDWVREVGGLLSGGRLGLGDGEQGSKAGAIDAVWSQATTDDVAEFPVPHSLGRIPVGYVVCGTSGWVAVWDSDTHAHDDRFLWLKADSPGVKVRLLVF